MTIRHIPVLLDKVVEFLRCKEGGIYVDCTIGGGGHAEAVLKIISPDGILIGIDRDREALERAAFRLRKYKKRVILRHGNFFEMQRILGEEGIYRVDGILIDLGMSSFQIDESERGFSFQRDGPLDMRMDRDSDERASDIVNKESEERLAIIIKEYGEERWAKRIARKIIIERAVKPIETTLRLADIVTYSIPGSYRYRRIHPATRTFQALRIAVNRELEFLGGAVKMASTLLNISGRISILSYHSLEDRCVKETFRRLAKGCICPPELYQCVCNGKATLSIVTKRPVVPDMEEITCNQRARSAKLRVAERI
ncbi:MAG: 16S rRNA (cytosine(1402)-N(4))-methyltransferase RsmH [Nitrospirota bacterium]